MTRLLCRIGCTNDIPDPIALFGDTFDFISDFYRWETGNKIEVEIDTSPLQKPFPVSRPGEVNAFFLHTMLRRLTKNPLGKRPVDTIALILARSYKGNETAFGMMFDEGYIFAGDPADDVVEPEVLGPPREGCAVFIDAISARRGPRGTSDFNRELRFTSLHELGHVFNLQHQDAQANIMRRSAVYGLQPIEAICLSSADRSRLSQDPLPFEYHPGGSIFGYGASSNAPNEWRFDKQKEYRELQIKIQVSHTELFAFEPIELDIEISLRPNLNKIKRIPRTVDPGYDNFRIWIEEPNGSLRMLSSPRHYCRAHSWLTITPDRPFKRDLSLGRQAGGPVFHRMGLHHVWAEMNIGNRGMLRSNRVTVRIRELSEMSRADKEAYKILRSPYGIILGYSRVWYGPLSIQNKIIELLHAFPNQTWSALLRYAIVRATIEKFLQSGKLVDLPKTIVSLAKIAVQDKALGEHRSTKVKNLLRIIRNEIQHSN